MSTDLEIIRKLKEEAQINREKRVKEAIARARMVPIVYVPAGSTLLRFYLDPENNIKRTLFRHKMGKITVPCLDNCEVCSYLTAMDEKYPDFRAASRLYSVQITIAYAWIFSCSEVGKFVRTMTPVLLMGNHKLGREVDVLVDSMDEEALGKMLDPSTDHVLWELKSYDRRLSLALTSETRTMDPLPKSLYPLSQCIHPEGQAPKTEQVDKFIEIIDEFYRTYIETAA